MAISVSMSKWTPGVQTRVEEFNERFPDLSWGTYPGHDPSENRASDGMVPAWQTDRGRARGWEVARWIWANRARLGVWYVIFDGKIISQTYPARGWAPYFARNDPNPSKSHKNHVHVSFYNVPAPTPPKPAAPVDPPKPLPEPTFELVAELDAPGAGNWQCAVQNATHWYLAQARVTDAGEDAIFHRFTKQTTTDEAGNTVPVVKLTSSEACTLIGGDHPTAFAVSDSGVIWTPHNGPRYEGGPDANDVVTFNWEPTAAGQGLVKATNTQLMHVFTDGPAHVSASPTRVNMVIRERTKTTDYYRWYAKADVLDGTEKQKGKTISRARAGAPVQGFTVIDDVLLVTSGAANEKTVIDAYSFTTGKLLRTLDITELGFKLAELEEFKASGVQLPKREAEGMDGWHVGIKVWEGEQRVLRVYRMNRWWATA